MGRHEPMLLREADGAVAPNARVLDAKFKEVRGERRTLWGRTKVVLQALLWAAAIGFLIPPFWVLLLVIRDTFGPL